MGKIPNNGPSSTAQTTFSASLGRSYDIGSGTGAGVMAGKTKTNRHKLLQTKGLARLAGVPGEAISPLLTDTYINQKKSNHKSILSPPKWFRLV